MFLCWTWGGGEEADPALRGRGRGENVVAVCWGEEGFGGVAAALHLEVASLSGRCVLLCSWSLACCFEGWRHCDLCSGFCEICLIARVPLEGVVVGELRAVVVDCRWAVGLVDGWISCLGAVIRLGCWWRLCLLLDGFLRRLWLFSRLGSRIVQDCRLFPDLCVVFPQEEAASLVL